MTSARGSRTRCQALNTVAPLAGVDVVGQRLQERFARDLFDRLLTHDA